MFVLWFVYCVYGFVVDGVVLGGEGCWLFGRVLEVFELVWVVVGVLDLFDWGGEVCDYGYGEVVGIGGDIGDGYFSFFVWCLCG